MFDFNKMRNFILIAETESISVAAHGLRRTQSAISQQLRLLEEELGLNLLERRGGQMHLTREGRKLQELITPLFDKMESGIREIQGRMDLVHGVVKIGISPSLCDYLLVSHLKNFSLKYPEISVELILLPDSGLEELLKRDSIDFAFIIEFMDRDWFQVTPCIEFNETLVATPKYIKQWTKHSGRQAPEYSDLFHAQFVDFGLDLPNVRHWLRKNSKEYRHILESKRASIVVEDYDSVKKLVSEGIGMAMLPDYMRTADTGLIDVFPRARPTKVGVDFATRKKKNYDAGMRIFSDFIRNSFGV